MIADSQTNFLFLSDLLRVKYPRFYQRFMSALAYSRIPVSRLLDTRDVWAKDYMPVQVAKDRFVQFVYDPSYLYPYWQHTRFDGAWISGAVGIKPRCSSIKLDGGNVVSCGHKVILTERVFSENPSYTRERLTRELESLLEVEQVIFVPEQPGDFTGHADGMVRFLDERTVLVNDYSGEDRDFREAFHKAVRAAGLDYVVVPYNPYGNKKKDSAIGIYINYLQMQGAFFVPVFGLPEDERAVTMMERLFKGSRVVAVKSNEIARQGGVLNCISWNIAWAYSEQ